MGRFKEIRTPDPKKVSSTARRAGRRRAQALAVPKGRAGLRPRAISPAAPIYQSIVDLRSTRTMSRCKEIRAPDHRKASSTARRAGRRRALALAVPKGRAGLPPRAVSPAALYKSITYDLARSSVCGWFGLRVPCFVAPAEAHPTRHLRSLSPPQFAPLTAKELKGPPLHPHAPLEAQTAPSAPGGSRPKKLTTNISHPGKTPLPCVAHSKTPCAPSATSLSE